MPGGHLVASYYYCSAQTERNSPSFTDEPKGLRLMMEGKQDCTMEVNASYSPAS